MKNILSIVVSIFTFIQISSAQTTTCNGIVPPITGENAWCGFDIDKILADAELVFEGRVLSDSVVYFNPPGVSNVHRVLVLKQFKGTFKSDTVMVAHIDDIVTFDGKTYVNKGDAGIFMVTGALNKTSYKIDAPDLYWIIFVKDCGFVSVCNKKKEEVQEMYAKLERHIGHKYVEVHPNTCATQKQK